jgi:hypothetical protein
MMIAKFTISPNGQVHAGGGFMGMAYGMRPRGATPWP